jgi:ribosome recycling factor
MSQDEVYNKSKLRMDKGIEALKNNIAKISTGRANTGLLEHIMVSCYGSDVPINQVATVSVIDARTLSVSPWDKSLLSVVEKSIHTADLGLNPMTYEDVIRVPIPQLTEDRRRSLVKVVKDDAEQSRVSIRQIRRDANTDIKKSAKDNALNEDDAKRAEAAIQKLTDDYVATIDRLVKEKETEIMSV